jgi:hypothetical protein
MSTTSEWSRVRMTWSTAFMSSAMKLRMASMVKACPERKSADDTSNYPRDRVTVLGQIEDRSGQ